MGNCCSSPLSQLGIKAYNQLSKLPLRVKQEQVIFRVKLLPSFFREQLTPGLEDQDRIYMGSLLVQIWLT